jgi:hypothetical protein
MTLYKVRVLQTGNPRWQSQQGQSINIGPYGKINTSFTQKLQPQGKFLQCNSYIVCFYEEDIR